MNQEQSTREFFNRIANRYRDKYAASSTFHNYFFLERVAKATQGLSFGDKAVLDIGAGTGGLYDALANQSPSLNYYACDISDQMLAQSRIPADRRFVGKCHELNWPVERFDLIFCLGVTTYLTPDELSKTLEFIRAHLSPEGQAIVSFTHRASLDHHSRTALKGIFRFLPLKDRVISQPIQTRAYELAEVSKLVSRDFTLNKVEWLNHTVFPLNWVFPRGSVSLAKRIDQAAKSAWLPMLSSDFLIFLKPKN